MTIQEATPTPRPETREPPSRLRGTIGAAARSGTIGAIAGAVVSLTEQTILRLYSKSHSPPAVVDRALGFVLTVSFFCIAALVVGGAAWLLGSLKSERAARICKVVGTSFAITTIAAFHGVATGLRLLLGSSLTVSGVQFFLNSTHHMVSALKNQYLGYVAAVLGGFIAVGAIVAVAVRRATRLPLVVRRAEVMSSFGMTTLAVIAVAAPMPSSLARRAAKTSPEVALLGGVPNRAERFPGEEFSLLTRTALESPKLGSLAAWKAGAEDIDERPNIVMITLETVGANHVGYMGYARNVTPNLDRISRRSVVFERAYTTATHSNYAQMAVLSSLFPRRGRSLDMYERLDYPRFLMHDIAYPLGYTTATISSQDETWQGMLRFQRTDTPTHYRHAPDYKGEHLNMVTEDIAPDSGTIDTVIDWIDSTEGKPFSLYVNLQSTHFPYPIPASAPHPYSPWEPKGAFTYVQWERRELDTIKNRYDNALHYVDMQVGRLYDALDERGLLDSTILVVTADHGESFFEHDYVTHGRALYETEARVPLLFHYPRWLVPRHVDEAVSTLDVTPTIIDLLGLDPHPALQGESVAWNELANNQHRAAVFLNIQGWKHYDGIVCMPYKLIYDPDGDDSSLFDLVQDPDEKNDVAAQHQDVVVALERVLMAQLEAQERYHADDDAGVDLRADRFAPSMLACPALPP